MTRQVLSNIDDLLRARMQFSLERAPKHRQIILWMIVFGLIYGIVMGSFGGITPDRFQQILYSAAKVPVLLAATFLLSLPSFFVINTLMGLRSDFAQVVRLLISTQAALTVILASFAPFTALWYLSFADYEVAKLFNAFMFGCASITAQLVLLRLYRPLIKKNPRHRVMVRLWLVIYAFVGIQMGWTLRPFIGKPGMETTFFRQEAFTNAYVEVVQTIMRAVGW